MAKTALLLSGGMDSTCIAYWKRPDVAIAIDYGQKPAIAELRAANVVAKTLGIPLEVIQIDCSSLGSGDLAGSEAAGVAPSSEWWPFRNQLLITMALMAAIRADVSELMIGTVVSDGSHADGRPDFVQAISQVSAMQEGGIRVTAPAIALTATELVRQSGIPFDLLGWAHSCHTGNVACGACRGCNKHRDTYAELGESVY